MGSNMKKEWMPIKDFPSYQVSCNGLIRSRDRFGKGRYGCKRYIKGRLKSQNISGYGYLTVTLYINSKRKTAAVHKLVAQAFIPNPKNKPQVNHINGIKHDNRIENLEWCTSSENIQHAHDTGLINVNRGSKVPNSKLCEEQVQRIRELIEDGLSPHEIAPCFKVARTTISDIKHKRTWKIKENKNA